MAEKTNLAIFASDRGPGDPERSSIMAQAGAFLARKGARLVCLAQNGQICGPVLAGAKASGGSLVIVADSKFAVPAAFSEVQIERIDDPEARAKHVGSMADAFVGLPGSLASISSLFDTWVKSGAGDSGVPVALLNRGHAFEALRGFAAEVVSARVANLEQKLIVTDNLDDLWNRLSRVVATAEL